MNILILKNKSNRFIFMTLIYKILQVISGFDYGFFQFERVFAKFTIKLATLAIFITINFMSLHLLVIEQYDWGFAWFMIYLVKYTTFFSFLLFLKPTKSLRSFYDDLFSVDSKFGVNSMSFNVEIKLMCTCFLFASFRLFIGTIYCVITDKCFEPSVINFVYSYIVACISILIISYAFIFFAVKCRFKKLSLVLENTESGFTVLQSIYKLYVDTVEKYKRAYDPLLIIVLCFTIPEVMSIIYLSLVDLRNHQSTQIEMCLEFIMAVYTLLTAFAPAICASMLSSQADQIIMVLHEKLFKQRDTAQKRQIERFIGYVGARSCRFRVYKVIPLDTDLLGMVLGFCVTYLIVIIQFTNTY